MFYIRRSGEATDDTFSASISKRMISSERYDSCGSFFHDFTVCTKVCLETQQDYFHGAVACSRSRVVTGVEMEVEVKGGRTLS